MAEVEHLVVGRRSAATRSRNAHEDRFVEITRRAAEVCAPETNR